MKLISVTDQVFDRHRGGKIEMTPKFTVLTRDDLSMAYTPDVGRICTAIAERTDLSWDYTIKSKSVAVLTNGTAVLGLGDLGPEAAMPVMEGKAMLFKQLAGVTAANARPISHVVSSPAAPSAKQAAVTRNPTRSPAPSVAN